MNGPMNAKTRISQGSRIQNGNGMSKTWALLGLFIPLMILANGGLLDCHPPPPNGVPLEVSVVPFNSGGQVSTDPDPDTNGTYTLGTEVTLTASPTVRYPCKDTPYWAFTGWSGDVTGPAPTVSIKMDSSKQVTAEFTEFLPEPCPSPDGIVLSEDPYRFEPSEFSFEAGTVYTLSFPAPGEFHTSR